MMRFWFVLATRDYRGGQPSAMIAVSEDSVSEIEGDDLCQFLWHIQSMTKLLEQAIREIEQLPADEQDAAAGALLDYVKHMHEMRLTDAQVAEVQRRITDPDRRFVSYDEARARIDRLGSS
jgi:hypothetical protein